METEPGRYTGTYTTPSSLVLDGGVIVIRAQDAAGNKVEAEAAGRLFVSAAQEQSVPEPDSSPEETETEVDPPSAEGLQP